MKVYFMGVCGTAMGNAALLARAAGNDVQGADSGVYPPMSTVLADAGIVLHEGYDPERLQKIAPNGAVLVYLVWGITARKSVSIDSLTASIQCASSMMNSAG